MIDEDEVDLNESQKTLVHKQEASRPDSSAIYNWFLATENLPSQFKKECLMGLSEFFYFLFLFFSFIFIFYSSAAKVSG